MKHFRFLYSLLLLALFAIAVRAEEPLSLSEDLKTELKAAAEDGKPLLVLVRNVQDAGTIDATIWLREDIALRPVLEKFHRVALWSGGAGLNDLKIELPGGLLFLTPKGEPIAVDDVPFLHADFKPLLEKILAAPTPMDEAARDALSAKPDPKKDRQRREKQLKGLSEELKEQLHELMKCARAQNDGKAAARGKELVTALLARPMSRDECLRSAGIMGYAIAELDLAGDGERLAEKIQKEAPVGRIAADAFLDLADRAFALGKREEAARYLADAAKASGDGESPTLYRAALAARALADGQSGPNHSKWAEREVLDLVVLVPNLASYAAAISRWDEKTFFPVLLEDDVYAPKFIAAFKPAQIILAPAEQPSPALSVEQLRNTLYASWQKSRAEKPAPPPPKGYTEEQLRERLNALGGASGVVITDGESGETAGALALAAGRFQALEILPVPKIRDKAVAIDQHLSKDAAWTMLKDINARMGKHGLPKTNAGWSYVTLAGAYPFRYSGDTDSYGYGNTYALDDLIGRDENGSRHSVVGRLLGDNARSAYQAMCSLFLQPESAFLFNTYGLNPKSIWGAYRMEFSDTAFKDRLALTHIKGEDAKIESFREHAFPWNRDALITINSSGGTTDWSVGGGGGTADDFPVGVPCAIHVTHSGSAGDPYNPDTLAGRAIWGGAFFYFGSVAEPFLSAFQPPNYYAPLIAQGAPLAAVFRKRTGQYFNWPWRLMIVGDPQFGLRTEPAKRKKLDRATGPAVSIGELDAKSVGPGKVVVAQITDAEQLKQVKARLQRMQTLSPLRRARLSGDFAEALNAAMKMVGADLTQFDAEDIPIALEVLIQARANDVAMKLWQAAPKDAQKIYAAQIYARQAAGALLDKALAAEDFESLGRWMDALLTTGPAGNFVERWLEKIVAVAEKKNSGAALSAWLWSRMMDRNAAAYRSSFAKRMASVRLKSLNLKEKWNGDDKAAALSAFSDAVKAKVETELLTKQYEEFLTSCVAKYAGASADSVASDIKGLFNPESDDGKRVASVFAEIATRKTFFKDWLILGPFKDEEKLDAAKLDFAATFSDHGEKLAWKRPYSPEAFGSIDLAALLTPHENVHAYAAAELIAEKDADGLLLLGSDDGIVAWLDGKEIHRNPAQRGLKPDDDKVALKIPAGKHTLLLRIDQGSGGWGFCARVAETDGKTPLAGVTWKCLK